MATRTKVIIGVLLVAVVAIGGGIYFIVGGDEPDEASLEGALAGVWTTTAGDSTDATQPASDATIDGAWTVDTTTGDFDFESATGTFAGFRIQENLAGIGATEAVGRTGDVSGTMTIEGTTVTEASFEVDLSTITSNDDRRNDRIQQALETGDFPTATFVLTAPIDLGAGAADGDAVSVTATGDLTIHGTTKSVEFPLQAQLSGDTVAVAGSLDVNFADYGVAVPQSQIVVSVEDHGPIELQLLLTKQ